MLVSEYLRRKYALQNTTYIRRNGEGVYIVDGKEVNEQEFKQKNKLPLNLYSGKENPDNTRSWQY